MIRSSIDSGRRARLAVLLAALGFSTGGAAIKLATLSGPQVACLRAGVAGLTLALLVPEARRQWTWRTWCVGVTYASTVTMFAIANKLTTAANTIFLQSTAPVYIVLISALFLHEPVRKRDLQFMAVIAIGMAFFFVGREPGTSSAPHPLQGNLLALGSGLSWALTITGLRWLSRSDDRPEAGAAGALAGNLIAFVFGLTISFPIHDFSRRDALMIVYLGIVQVGISYRLLVAGLQRVPALEASLLLFIEPALNPVWTWVVHGEQPGRWAIVGGAIIIGATLVNTVNGARQARTQRSESAAAP